MTSLRFRIVFLAAVVLAAPSAWPGERPSEAAIREILTGRIDAGQSVGIVVGWIDAEGRVVVGHGRRGPDDEAAPDGETVFEIGSITKVFTGTLLAEMTARNEIDPSRPARTYLPDEVTVPVAEGGEPITLYHLATHTSGLPRMPTNIAPRLVHLEKASRFSSSWNEREPLIVTAAQGNEQRKYELMPLGRPLRVYQFVPKE